MGRLLGDILVLRPSATGRGRTRRIPFDAEHGHHVSPAHHLALLNHPEVYGRLRGWLEPPDRRLVESDEAHRTRVWPARSHSLMSAGQRLRSMNRS